MAQVPLFVRNQDKTVTGSFTSVAADLSANVLVTSAAKTLSSSTVTATELGYTQGVTGNLQAALDGTSASVVGLAYDWSTSNVAIATLPLAFTPEPLRSYTVEASLVTYAEAPDYTAGVGVRWPFPLLENTAAVATVAYPVSAADGSVYRSSGGADVIAPFSTSNVANVPMLVTLQASFTTANSAQSPFYLIANTSTASRKLYCLYGSQLTYQSAPIVPNFSPNISTVLASSYALSPNTAPTTITLNATDPEGANVTWSYQVVAGSLGNAATVTQSANVFTITPSVFEADYGTFTLRFTASDGLRSSFRTAVFTMAGTAPVITSNIAAAYTLSNVGTPTVISASAVDAEGSPITWNYQITSGTLGNTATIVRSGNTYVVTPSTNINDNGTFGLRFSASDGTNTSYSNIANVTLNIVIPPAGVLYQTPGTYSWTAPVGVSNVCVVCVGGGGGGGAAYWAGGGGGGGGLGWKNAVAVTPGSSYTVVVGAGGTAAADQSGQKGGDSYFINASTVCGYGGNGGYSPSTTSNGAHPGGTGGSYVGTGGGTGGQGGTSYNDQAGGGAGAGGYSGNGGNGSTAQSGATAGAGGGGGGGSGAGGSGASPSGGGVGVYGQGSNGAAGSTSGGQGGSGGGTGSGETSTGGSGNTGGIYGGGGGGQSTDSRNLPGCYGGRGAVRIIWGGVGRAFPSSNVSLASSTAGETSY